MLNLKYKNLLKRNHKKLSVNPKKPFVARRSGFFLCVSMKPAYMHKKIPTTEAGTYLEFTNLLFFPLITFLQFSFKVF